MKSIRSPSAGGAGALWRLGRKLSRGRPLNGSGAINSNSVSYLLTFSRHRRRSQVEGNGRSVPSQIETKVRAVRRRRLLLWVAIAGLIFGLIGFGELPEDMLRVGRNSLHPHKASGEIVLVTIDDRSLREVGRWPWPRRHHAAAHRQADRGGRKADLLRHHVRNTQRPGRRRIAGRSDRDARAG